MEEFEFQTDSLSSFIIEDIITLHYGIGYSSSSNFMELELGVHRDYHIMSSKGSIDFSAIVGKNKNGKRYIVTIRPIKLNKK